MKRGALPRTPSRGSVHRRGIVLVVDDDPPLLVALERQFRGAGLYPLTTGSIEGAWKVLGLHVVHCIVADERLGDGSGAEFLVDVGRTYRGVGRILLTGFLDGYLTQRASEAGFVALDKSCKFREILAAVNREIGNA